MRLALTFMLAAAVGGCGRGSRALIPCQIGDLVHRVNQIHLENVDLLLVVDNSHSMATHQRQLAAQLPNLIQAMTSGDVDGDGVREFRAVRSLNVGIVTTDMGTGGHRIPTCADPDFGDDGLFRTHAGPADSCERTYPTFQNFRREDAPDEVDAFARSVACVAVAGTDGCGLEQPLEAALKAITPSSSDTRFHAGSVGHADGSNAGFLRADAVLVVVVLTDEDDCSVRDPALFDVESPTFPGDLNLRCLLHGPEEYARQGRDPATSPVWEVERFVDGLLDAKATPDTILFAAVTGIPEGLSPSPPIDYDAILGHALMRERPDPELPNRLVPSCITPTSDTASIVAYPPRRLVRAGQLLEAAGAHVVLQSLCQDDLTQPFDAILRELAVAFADGCLPNLERNRAGQIPCMVTEELAPGRRCDEISGRVLLRTTTARGEEVEVCRVNQLAVRDGVVAPGDGWFYERDDSAEMHCPPSRASRISAHGPALADHYDIQCWHGGWTSAAPEAGLGSPCEAGCGQQVGGHQHALVCDPTTNTCQAPCEDTSECEGGYTCSAGFCVNPSC